MSGTNYIESLIHSPYPARRGKALENSISWFALVDYNPLKQAAASPHLRRRGWIQIGVDRFLFSGQNS